MDDKQSSLRDELVTTKDALNRALLEKEIMEAEKAEVVDALSKVGKLQEESRIVFSSIAKVLRFVL